MSAQRVALACWTVMIFTACTGSRPQDLGLKDDKLRPCPDAPNCVASSAEGKEQYIPPLANSQPCADGLEQLKTILTSLERTIVDHSTENYIHAEAASKVFGFVDDVEIHCPTDGEAMQWRSEARLGRKDFNVNRDRLEQIRGLYSAASSQ